MQAHSNRKSNRKVWKFSIIGKKKEMKLLKLVCSDEGGDRKEKSNKSRRTTIHLRTFEKAVMGKGKEKRPNGC